MPLVVLLHDISEELVALGLPLDLLLPLGAREAVADVHDLLEEIVAEFFADQLEDPEGDEVELHVDVHCDGGLAPAHREGLILDAQVPVVDLDVGGVEGRCEIEPPANVLAVVDGLTVDEDGVVVLEPVVAHALKDRLTHRQDRQVEQAVPYFVVPPDVLLLPRHLYVRDQLAEEVQLRDDSEEYLDGHLHGGLHENAHSPILSPRVHVDPVFLAQPLPEGQVQRLCEFVHLAVGYSDFLKHVFGLLHLLGGNVDDVEVDLLEGGLELGDQGHAKVEVVFLLVESLQLEVALVELFVEVHLLLPEVGPLGLLEDLAEFLVVKIELVAAGEGVEAVVQAGVIALGVDLSVGKLLLRLRPVGRYAAHP